MTREKLAAENDDLKGWVAALVAHVLRLNGAPNPNAPVSDQIAELKKLTAQHNAKVRNDSLEEAAQLIERCVGTLTVTVMAKPLAEEIRALKGGA